MLAGCPRSTMFRGSSWFKLFFVSSDGYVVDKHAGTLEGFSETQSLYFPIVNSI